MAEDRPPTPCRGRPPSIAPMPPPALPLPLPPAEGHTVEQLELMDRAEKELLELMMELMMDRAEFDTELEKFDAVMHRLNMEHLALPDGALQEHVIMVEIEIHFLRMQQILADYHREDDCPYCSSPAPTGDR